MTVWDALALTRAEDAEGVPFRVNERFRVSSCDPRPIFQFQMWRVGYELDPNATQSLDGA
jgi:hypothetical protein